MRKVVLETCMRDCAVGLHVYFSSESSSTFIFYVCVQWELALAALQRWAGSSEHSLFAYATTLISACIINHQLELCCLKLLNVLCVCVCSVISLFYIQSAVSLWPRYYIEFLWFINVNFSPLRCLRPYHVENTGSRPITEVKQRRARLVLGWVTAWEYRVL